jgi:hypothetical protein
MIPKNQGSTDNLAVSVIVTNRQALTIIVSLAKAIEAGIISHDETWEIIDRIVMAQIGLTAQSTAIPTRDRCPECLQSSNRDDLNG